MTLDVYIDGSGNGTYGFVVKRTGEILTEESGVIRDDVNGVSNNELEYTALVKALRWLKDNNFHSLPIVIYSDSKLVVNQMLGKWRTKSGAYLEAHMDAKASVVGFKDIRFIWIPRERNWLADSLTRGRKPSYSLQRGAI